MPFWIINDPAQKPVQAPEAMSVQKTKNFRLLFLLR